MAYQYSNPMASFAYGFGTMGDHLRAQRALKMQEEEFALRKQDRDTALRRQDMQDSARWLTGALTNERGEFDFTRANALIGSKQMNSVLSSAVSERVGEAVTVTGISPSATKGQYKVHVKLPDGTEDILGDEEGEFTMDERNVPGYILGATAQYAPEAFDAIRTAMKENATLEDLTSFYEGKLDQPVTSPPADIATPASAAQTSTRAALSTTPTAQVARPAAAPTPPQAPVPTAPTESVPPGREYKAAPDPTPARLAGERARAAGEAVLEPSAVAGRIVTSALGQQFKKAAQVGRDFIGGLTGEPAATSAPAPAPRPPASATPPKKSVVIEPLPADTPRPAPRAQVAAIAERIVTPASAKAGSKGPKAPSISAKEKRTLAHRLARLQIKGAITAGQAEEEIDRVLGRRKPAHTADLGDRVVFMDKDLNPLLSLKKNASPESVISANAAVAAARYKMLSKLAEKQGEDNRNLFKDRETWYSRIQSSEKDKSVGRQMVADIDAAVDDLGLDIYAPGVSSLVEEAARA